MALITANELKRKLLITVDGQPYVVLEVFFASPTARGAATMVRTRLRQLLTGAVMEKSFRSSEKFAEPDIELSPASFLYSDAHGFHFMDEKSYEQFTFDEAAIDADRGYLKEGVSLQVLKYNGAPVSLQLPQYVELAVYRPSWACAATPPPVAQPSRPPWKPDSPCAFHSLSRKANSSALTRKPAKSRAALSFCRLITKY